MQIFKPLILVALLAQTALPQAAPAQSTVGEVKKVDQGTRVISLKTDAGAEMTVTLLPTATFRRVAPGQTDLTKAETITLGDVAVGDRVLARGRIETTAVSATMIVVMSQGDLVKKRAAEQADWVTRGVTGLVTATSAETVTINVRSLAGVKPVVITPAASAVIRRYAPDSVSFNEAKLSPLTDVKVGDQIRARGDKSPDGSKVAAVEVVYGTFKTIAGVIQAIDAATGEMRVNDLDAKKPVIIKVTAESSMKKLQLQLAQAIAQRLHPETAAAAAARGGGRPAQAAPEAPAGGGRPIGGRGPGGGGDVQAMLDSSPKVTLAELKVGDAIVVTSTVGATAGKMTAITLLAGMEPILTKPGTQEMSLGSWNVDGGGGGGGFGGN